MKAKDKAPVSLRIRLKYPDVETFVEKYAPNISRGGMFIQSRAPQPVGTQLRFELLIQDGVRLLKGEGRVVWIKEYDASKPTQAHGMGVRFTELDDESQSTVERILAYKQQSSTEPPKMPRARRSHTLEVRGLASLVAPTAEAEEPQEARLSGEHPSVQALLAGDAAQPSQTSEPSQPAPLSRGASAAQRSGASQTAQGSERAAPLRRFEDVAPTNGVAVERAEQALAALIAEAGLDEAVVADARQRALSQELSTDGIDGLEALLQAPDEEEADAAAAREALRLMLGAPTVPEVAPLSTTPTVMASEDDSSASEGAEAGDAPAIEPAAAEPVPPLLDDAPDGGRTSESLAVGDKAPLSSLPTPPPEPGISTGEQISLEALAAKAQSGVDEGSERFEAYDASPDASPQIYDGLDDVTVPQVQREPERGELIEDEVEDSTRVDASPYAFTPQPQPRDFEAPRAQAPADQALADDQPLEQLEALAERASDHRVDHGLRDEPFDDELLIEDEDDGLSDDTDIGHVPEVVYEDDDEPLSLDDSPFEPATEPHGQQEVPAGVDSFGGAVDHTLDQPGFDESLLEAAANIARTSREEKAPHRQNSGFGEPTSRDEIVFASRVPDLTADVPLDEPEDAPTTQRFEQRHMHDPRLQQSQQAGDQGLRSVSTDELVDFGPDDTASSPHGGDDDAVDFGPSGDDDLVDFGPGDDAPVHIEGADELSDDVWREVVADIKRRDERSPYRGEPIMPRADEPPAQRAHRGQRAANLPQPGHPRRPSSAPYPTVESVPDHGGYEEFGGPSHAAPSRAEPTLDHDHLAHDPDLDDEVFAALAGIRSERANPSGESPTVRPVSSTGEPPSLESLARDTEAHAPVQRRPPPAEGDDFDTMLSAGDVVAEDGEESADIKARRSGLFKRLFGRKD